MVRIWPFKASRGGPWRGSWAVIVLVALFVSVPLQSQRAAPLPGRPNVYITFSEARPIFETLHENWPAELRGLPPHALEEAWPGWVRRRDDEIRARLDRGHEDSIVNLWLYGTAFTQWPRAVEPDMAQAGGAASAADIVSGRLEDLLGAMADPGGNERVRFAREVFDRRGLRPATAEGRAGIRRALVAARERALGEYRAWEREVESAQDGREPGAAIAAHATMFRDRGLSSDTSALIGFAVEQALRGMMATGTLSPGRMTRVGIVGPGLEFINKADGYDFYPEQTIQPFALVDSLARLGLADPGRVRVTTFDINPRVDEHIQRARDRARDGGGYTLHLPINRLDRWRPDFLDFWTRFGDRIGDSVPVTAPPSNAGTARVRAVRVRPDAVLAIQPANLNIALERPAVMAREDQFDLLVATNVLLYYDRFEQALALANVAAMLRPGGVLLTNNAVLPIPPFKPAAHHLFVVYSERHSDHVFWYQRQ